MQDASLKLDYIVDANKNIYVSSACHKTTLHHHEGTTFFSKYRGITFFLYIKRYLPISEMSHVIIPKVGQT